MITCFSIDSERLGQKETLIGTVYVNVRVLKPFSSAVAGHAPCTTSKRSKKCVARKEN